MTTLSDAGTLDMTAFQEDLELDDQRITVMLDLPHLEKYDRETMRELVYGCDFTVAIGDLVSCPPTPLYSRWTTGVVVALDGGQYRGPVKYVRPIKRNQ